LILLLANFDLLSTSLLDNAGKWRNKNTYRHTCRTVSPIFSENPKFVLETLAPKFLWGN
jgi:hypothetical protein